MAWLKALDSRISIHYGRLEQRTVVSEVAKELKRYLSRLTVRIDPTVYKELVSLAQRHESLTVAVEKAVDVMIAVDMVRMAERDEYDTAYLLSADGDYTPAVEAVADIGKKVFAASVAPAGQLARAVYKFLPLKTACFNDCFGD